jgi:hypothetical protein
MLYSIGLGLAGGNKKHCIRLIGQTILLFAIAIRQRKP